MAKGGLIMAKLRLDKLLANCAMGTRKEVKVLIKQGLVVINDKIAKDPGMYIDTDADSVFVDGNNLEYKEFYYLMMNKPAGLISATEDKTQGTVLDIIPYEYSHINLFPVGRLDKDTEGLLVFTNDGKLAHRLLSPKKHVPKTYFAQIEGLVTNKDIEIFEKGITLDEDFTTLPSQLEILESKDISKVMVSIYEGKFHQIKRMFEYVGKKVIYLKRISMGNLKLDKSLSPGNVRELTDEEIRILYDSDN